LTRDDPLVDARDYLRAEVRSQPYPLIFITVSGGPAQVEVGVRRRLPQIPDLIAQKLSGAEWAEIADDLTFHQSEYERLCGELEAAATASRLAKASPQRTS